MNKLKVENQVLRGMAAEFARLLSQYTRATEADFPDPDTRPAATRDAYNTASAWLRTNTNIPLRSRL